MIVLDWTNEGNGAQIADIAETAYLVRNLGQNGGQTEIRKTGDPFPSFRNDRSLARCRVGQKYAETVIIGNGSKAYRRLNARVQVALVAPADLLPGRTPGPPARTVTLPRTGATIVGVILAVT